MLSINSNSGLNRLRLAIAGGTLLTASGFASAVPVSLNLDYTCTYPLIGTQPLSIVINSDMPESMPVGQSTGAFDLDVVATAKGNTWGGLNIVSATSIEGTATAYSNISGNNLSLDLQVPTNIANQAIPPQAGDFDLIATGQTPPLTFTESNVGDIVITVGNLDMALLARKADNSPVFFAESDPTTGVFPSICTMVAGQDNVLHTFEVVSANAPADISVTPSSVDFGNVQAGLTATETVTVSNIGGAVLGINNIALSGADSAQFSQTNNCSTVADGASCQVDVTYFANGDASHSAELTIDSTDEDEPTVSVPLTGTSEMETNPNITVDPASVSFGQVTVGTSANRTVTISNDGTAALTITGVALDGANASEFMQTNTCSTVGIGSDCSVALSFTPNGQGARNANLTITSDDPDSPSVQVPVSGQGFEDTGTGVLVVYDLVGNSYIKAAKGSIDISGTIDADLDLASQTYTADLALNPTHGEFKLVSWLKSITTIADIEFEQVGQTTGTLNNAGKLTSHSEMYIKLSKVSVNLFGLKFRVGGGAECKTIEPATMDLASPDDQPFDPLQTGGTLQGTYTLPPVADCGGFDSIINSLMAGSGNTITLNLTPKP
jgi:hypothetical protein